MAPETVFNNAFLDMGPESFDIPSNPVFQPIVHLPKLVAKRRGLQRFCRDQGIGGAWV
jgi:hypothetical protein